MGLLIFFFLISLIFSFLCSIWEAVLLSITPSYISTKEGEGSSIAKDLKKFKDEIDRPLAAILSLNTIAHTVGAIGVGAQAGIVFGKAPLEIGPISLHGESIVAVIVTLAILIFSEIIPKTIGANNWKALAPFTISSIKILIFSIWPLVWISQFITKRLKKDKDKPVFARNDFIAMAATGEKSGVLDEGESKIITNLLQFDKVLVKDVMTPRTVVISAEENETLKDFHEAHEDLWFSRIPLYSETSDNVTGFFLKDELLLNIIHENGDKPLSSIRREITVTDVNFPIPELFKQLLANREHIALVMDEFGGMAGIVTMEDLIETLLGMEIVDELDNVEDMQALARRNWEKRAKKIGLITQEEDQKKDENTTE